MSHIAKKLGKMLKIKTMTFERRTSLQFQKDLSQTKNLSITYRGFGGRKYDDVPETFAVLVLTGISYVDKMDRWLERYPYSDATFRGKQIDLCIHSDCPNDWYSIKDEKKFLRIDSVDEEDPLTIYWNIGELTTLAMIQESINQSSEIYINLTLDAKESYFMDLDRKLSHEIRITSINLDF